MKALWSRLLFILIFFYAAVCICVYFFQEKLIFFPQQLRENFQFSFDSEFKEIKINSSTGNMLHGLLFPADSSKGMVVYFHGNAGSLESWGNVYEEFLRLQYSLLIIDYPGYGKSKGKMSEQNLFLDAQAVYNLALNYYPEDRVIIYGRSVGTGVAAWLAAENNPRMLILEAPYFSMEDLSSHLYPFLPSFLLRYPLRTDLYLQRVKSPVVIFHGSDDEVIYAASSAKLKELFKPGDKLHVVNGAHHNDLKFYEEYQALLSKTLQ